MRDNYSYDLIYFFNVRGTGSISYSGDPVRPSDFLGYAQVEYANKKRNQRNCLNTVSSARLALLYQIDSVSDALGWRHLFQNGGWRPRLEFLLSCGVLNASLFKRLIGLGCFTDIAEPYALPSEEEALDYLDAVEVFFGASHLVSNSFPDLLTADLDTEMDGDFRYVNMPQWLLIRFPVGGGVISISSENGEICVFKVGEPEYAQWVKSVIAQNQGA
jgi:hypothetical protein